MSSAERTDADGSIVIAASDHRIAGTCEPGLAFGPRQEPAGRDPTVRLAGAVVEDEHGVDTVRDECTPGVLDGRVVGDADDDARAHHVAHWRVEVVARRDASRAIREEPLDMIRRYAPRDVMPSAPNRGSFRATTQMRMALPDDSYGIRRPSQATRPRRRPRPPPRGASRRAERRNAASNVRRRRRVDGGRLRHGRAPDAGRPQPVTDARRSARRRTRTAGWGRAASLSVPRAQTPDVAVARSPGGVPVVNPVLKTSRGLGAVPSSTSSIASLTSPSATPTGRRLSSRGDGDRRPPRGRYGCRRSSRAQSGRRAPSRISADSWRCRPAGRRRRADAVAQAIEHVDASIQAMRNLITDMRPA